MCGKDHYFGVHDIKFINVFITFLTFISGLLLLKRGFIAFEKIGRYEDCIGTGYRTGPIGFLIIGAMLMPLAIFGYFTIRDNSSNVMAMYIASLLVTGVTLMTLGFITQLYLKNSFISESEPVMKTKMKEYLVQNFEHSSLNAIQTDYTCCGIDSPMDYWNLPENFTSIYPFTNFIRKLPNSCCTSTKNGTCGLNDRVSRVNMDGCWAKVSLNTIWTNQQLSILGLASGVCLFLGAAISYSYLVVSTQFDP